MKTFIVKCEFCSENHQWSEKYEFSSKEDAATNLSKLKGVCGATITTDLLAERGKLAPVYPNLNGYFRIFRYLKEVDQLDAIERQIKF